MQYHEQTMMAVPVQGGREGMGTLLLLAALLASVLLLPVCGAIKPADPDIAAAREAIAAYLGKDTPGAALVLVRKGQDTLKEGFGYASINDKANNILVHPNTVFEIGEISSVFVALAAYRLSQEGWLDLNKDITDYLPDHVIGQLGLRYHTTVRDLLLGCAGFEGRTFDLRFDDDGYRFDSLEAALLSEVPKQVYMPGERYTKSPFGMALAAYVVECAAGQSYEEYVKARILEPLGMEDTVLNPNRHVWPTHFAVGHKVTAEGQFATAANSGRSYAGFYPVSGALSSAADMAKLVEFMLNGNATVLDDAVRAAWLSEFYKSGVFTLSSPGMEARGNVSGTVSATHYFGASLWINYTEGKGAVVLTNAAESGLLSLAATLCNAPTGGTGVSSEGELPDINRFAGNYLSLAEETHSFVGLWLRKDRVKTVSTTEGGAILFDGVELRQVAPGLFADAQSGDVVLQFVFDEYGNIRTLETFSGDVLRPAHWFEGNIVSLIMFYLLLAFAVWFLLAGILALVRYLLRRDDPDTPGLVYVIPLLFATLMSVSVLVQIGVGLQYGTTAFSSFFHAFSVITLVLSIGATVGLIVDFAASLIKKGMPSRVIRTSVLYLIYVGLVSLWQLSALSFF